jgi:hypothetical protein
VTNTPKDPSAEITLFKDSDHSEASRQNTGYRHTTGIVAKQIAAGMDK